MDSNLRWKIGVIVIAVLAAVICLVPTFVSDLPGWWVRFLSEDKISLGLDLQGGTHLILGVKTEEAVKSSMEQLQSDLKQTLRDEKIPFLSIESGDDYSIKLTLANQDYKDKLEDLLERFPQLEPEQIGGEQPAWNLSLRPAEEQRIRDSAVSQGLETIRNRIDQFGVAEPSIQRQGNDQILVQLPGVKDTRRAIQLIGRTAMLEFKLVNEEASIDEALKGKLPKGSELLYGKKTIDKNTGLHERGSPYIIIKKAVMAGDVLTDARMQIDTEYAEPYVLMTFDSRGGRLFARITEANVKRRMAIVLDGTVYSAPVIQEKIEGGRAQITGNFTTEEAHDLAIVLRAGALPAPVEIQEQRTVGPSLGHDSIRKGILAIIAGGIFVLIFMVVYYRLSGILADLALLLNLLFLMAVMTFLKATLTLPGIAGIVLTVGMAVDANVLIFQRIREELRGGKSVRTAIDQGYKRAFTTILDANLTTLIAALVLFQFGTGPIRGFAVTLSLGLAISMITAIWVTRIAYDLALQNRKVAKLSI